MGFNPLQEKGIPIDRQFRNWSELNVKPYDKNSVDPYTQCRVITMNGIEVEAVMFSHQFARHTTDLDLKRQLALVRRAEQQQQKAVCWLVPGEASNLETVIGYEQVAVDLTAWVAQNEPNPYARQAYEFGLLEDFDHLYRYANLMDMLEGKKAEKIVKGLTEITPGRPTIAEHRHPMDDVRKPLDRNKDDPRSLLHALTITAAEQQTMNYYMNIGNRPTEPMARGLYLEIAQIEEQHVTHYESLLDAGASWAEMLVLHEYNECYLYYSFMQQEPDPRIRQIWELHLAMEIEHLRIACELMRQTDKKDPEAMLPKELPEAVTFQSNKEYVRQVLGSQINLTANETEFVPVETLAPDHRYFAYQRVVNGHGPVPSEQVIDKHVKAKGREYRLEVIGPSPVEEFRKAG
ncbi:hypothetical protein [Rhodospirillaceae bacterium SYSU D60014]|uniref:hypothetical protein n=1 Tax=Virgifigura deserti TaxID=2268457 RepID=UPI000E66AF6B